MQECNSPRNSHRRLISNGGNFGDGNFGELRGTSGTDEHVTKLKIEPANQPTSVAKKSPQITPTLGTGSSHAKPQRLEDSSTEGISLAHMLLAHKQCSPRAERRHLLGPGDVRNSGHVLIPESTTELHNPAIANLFRRQRK